LTEADKSKLDAKKKAQYSEQTAVDKQLLANIKKVDMLKKYLSARFTLSKGQKPHEMKF
jgi:large subunit ribosomal protein L6e